MAVLGSVSLLSHEGHEPHAEHVERGHESGDDSEHPEDGEPDGLMSGLHGDLEDEVLGPESAEERESCDGQGTEQHGDRGDLHVLVETSHLSHVFSAHGVDDGSGAHEQQGLEEGVVHHVEASCDESCGSGDDQRVIAVLDSQGDEVSSGSESEEHVSELGDGGEGEDLLDVHVVHRHGGGEERGDSSDYSDEEHDVGVLDEQGVSPCDEIDSGLDHGRGVDQRGDGCRTGHRIGQPVVQGELSALSDDSSEDEEHSERQHVGVGEGDVGLVEQSGVVQAVELAEQDEQTGHEAHVTETGDQERFLRSGSRIGGGSVALGVPEGPESDEQVRAQSHDLPEDEQLQEVAGDDQSEHTGQEQGDLGVVPRLPGALVSHVSDGVHEDQSGDERGEQHHYAGQVVHVVSKVDCDVADVEPFDAFRCGVGILVTGVVLVGDQHSDYEC